MIYSHIDFRGEAYVAIFEDGYNNGEVVFNLASIRDRIENMEAAGRDTTEEQKGENQILAAIASRQSIEEEK